MNAPLEGPLDHTRKTSLERMKTMSLPDLLTSVAKKIGTNPSDGENLTMKVAKVGGSGIEVVDVLPYVTARELLEEILEKIQLEHTELGTLLYCKTRLSNLSELHGFLPHGCVQVLMEISQYVGIRMQKHLTMNGRSGRDAMFDALEGSGVERDE